MSGNVNIFHKYNYNSYFIETGSYYGRGIEFAIEAGFKNIISIEITQKYYELCKEKFKNNKNVKIVLGDSVKELGNILSKINKPVTFWLDGHYTEPSTEYSEVGWCPLLHELDIIKEHKIKNHTILIDDLRCWNPQDGYFSHYNFTESDLRKKILEINSDYKFSYEDGYIPNDILVAKI
jgi:hypothetical protein